MYEYVEDAEKIFTDGSKMDIAYMVLEYIPRAEVFYYLAGNFFNDDVCRHLFLQMLDAVEFLHNNNISHRDLKPENLLFDDEWKIRVIDFNFSAPTRGRDGTGILTTFMG
jgi:serine/threonine protein kinase